MLDGVPLLNGFRTPSTNVYCKREVVEVILVKLPGGEKGEYLFKVVPSSNPLPDGYKVSRNFRLISVQKSSPETKLMATPKVNRIDSPKIQRKLTLCSKANERIKGPQP